MPTLRHLAPTLAVLAGFGAIAAEDAVEHHGEITVTADTEEPGYAADSSSTGTKTDTPIMELPQSVGIVTGDLLRDRNAVRLVDALRNVPGVSVGGYYSEWDYYRIRGFDAAFTTRVDGLKPLYDGAEETFGLERIEVLKGPAAMLYGESPIGGLVNLTSKKPRRDEDSTSLSTSAGSFGEGEFGLDAGMASDDGDSAARLVAMYRVYGSPVEHVEMSERIYLAPSASWWLGDATTVTVLAQYQKRDVNTAWPLPASGFILDNPNGDLPLDRNIGEPGFQNHVDLSRRQVGYQVDHRLADHLIFRQNLRLESYEGYFQGIYLDNLQVDGRTLDRSAYTYDDHGDSLHVDTTLQADVATGSVGHLLLIGLDYRYYRTGYVGGYSSIDPIDIFAPVYGAEPDGFSVYGKGDTTTTSVGLYVQDQMAVTDRLDLTVGLRIDLIDTDDYDQLADNTVSDEHTGTTGRLGATWAVIEEAALFGSLSTAFTPQPSSRTPSGGVVDPSTGYQMEVGVRTRLLDGAFHGTAAIFHIVRSDVATGDPSNPGFSVITGEQRSQGLELDGVLRGFDGWELSAGYAYLDVEVTKDNDLPEGDRLQGVPDHNLTVWVRYTIPDGSLRGVGIGLGANYVGDQAGDLPNTFELPSYVLVDAALYYDRGPLGLQLNISNLLDEEYAMGSYNDLYVLPGDPLTVTATVTLDL